MTCSGSDHTADPGLGPRSSPGIQCSSHAPSCQLEDLPPHSCTPTPGPGKERPVWKQVWNRGNQRCQSSPILTAQHPSLPMFLLFSSSILIPSVKLQHTLRACCSSPSQMGTSTGKIQPSHSMANMQPQKPGTQGNEERAPRNYAQP